MVSDAEKYNAQSNGGKVKISACASEKYKWALWWYHPEWVSDRSAPQLVHADTYWYMQTHMRTNGANGKDCRRCLNDLYLTQPFIEYSRTSKFICIQMCSSQMSVSMYIYVFIVLMMYTSACSLKKKSDIVRHYTCVLHWVSLLFHSGENAASCYTITLTFPLFPPLYGNYELRAYKGCTTIFNIFCRK